MVCAIVMFSLTIQDANGQQISQSSFEQGSFVLGRMEGCDIVLPSSSVSRKHARLFVHAGRCYIEDLGSANGIIVDGQRVVGRRDLGTASQIRIGDYYLFIEHQRRGPSNEQRVLQTVFIPRDSDHYKLVRVFDSFAGEEFVLSETDNTIGRTDENFILLSDPSISRHHAKIVREGDHYIAHDLGSSNGSSVNAKPLKKPAPLKAGDHVRFGNVEFVFVEGDKQVDTRNYVRAPSSQNKTTKLAASAILLLVGIAIGGVLLFGLSNMKKENDQPAPPQPPTERPADTLETKVAELMQRGDGAMEREKWDLAIASFDEVLAVEPENADATKSLQQAKLEKSAAELFERGAELSESGKFEEAKKTLTKVPSDTTSSEQAAKMLDDISQSLSFAYKSEAMKLLKKGKRKKTLLEAHDKLVLALQHNPEDADAKSEIDKLEKTLKKRRIKFDSYQQ